MSREELIASSFPDRTDEPHMGETAEAERRAGWVSSLGLGVCPRVQLLLQAGPPARMGLPSGQELLKNVGTFMQHFLLREAFIQSED